MKYTDLHIQTQREAPNNAQTQGISFLVRAGYLTRKNEPLPLGSQAIDRLQNLIKDPSLLFQLSIPLLPNDREIFFPIAGGDVELIHCAACKYTERVELAQFTKSPLPQESELPLEKVNTPDCNTIESLAGFLNIPKEKTAKALMYTRVSDGLFILVVMRGDMQISETKLTRLIGEVKLADVESIHKAGAAAGFASPIGLKHALTLVDDLIPRSHNLAAGANEAGFHFINTNYQRDYSASHIADLAQARQGDACKKCGSPLSTMTAISLAKGSEYRLPNILLALAETHHDDKGLMIPLHAAPFDIYLMHVPGKTLNTQETAQQIYNTLQAAGISTLLDDREERAGVKFNDADLIGCPVRITVGEKALKDGLVEIKQRSTSRVNTLPLENILNLKDISEILQP